MFRWREGELIELNETHGLDGNRAIAFSEDREGNVWLGMNGAGLYRLREKRLRLFNQRDGLVNLSLSGVTEDAAGDVLANIMGWTMHRFKSNRFVSMDVVAAGGDPYTYPTALVPAREGGVWAGTYFGQLPRIQDGRVVERIGSASGTRSLFRDKNGDLWRGTRTGGVEYFSVHGMTRYSTHEGLNYHDVYAITQDTTGAVWVGTEEGLNRIEDGRIRCFDQSDGLGHSFVTSLVTDKRGVVWAGTLGGGLGGWNGARFITLTSRHGLADDTVQQLLEDDYGNLWIGTRVGLMRIGLDVLGEFLNENISYVTGTLIGRNEGLPRPDCWTEYQPANLKTRDGNLWFCTGSGLVLLDPRRFAQPAPPPRIHIEDVFADGTAVYNSHTSTPDIRPSPTPPPQSDIVIPAGGEQLELRYTGLSPSAPELEISFYRIVQECVNNVVKHSAATTASVTLRRAEHDIRLTVTDNGRGCSLERNGPDAQTGFGLKSITERARTMGGKVHFRSQPGQGMRVELEVPLK